MGMREYIYGEGEYFFFECVGIGSLDDYLYELYYLTGGSMENIYYFLNCIAVSEIDETSKKTYISDIINSYLDNKMWCIDVKATSEDELIIMEQNIDNILVNLNFKLICLSIIFITGIFLFFVSVDFILRFITLLASSICLRRIITLMFRYILFAEKIEYMFGMNRM